FERFHEEDLENDPPSWAWANEYKPSKVSLNSLIESFVRDGLEKMQSNIQKMHPKLIKSKQGFEEILRFLLDHPEIEYPTTEHFRQDDPAYPLLQTPYREDGETEWTFRDDPHNRTKAAHGIAADEALIKADKAALEAIERALAPSRARAPDPEAE